MSIAETAFLRIIRQGGEFLTSSLRFVFFLLCANLGSLQVEELCAWQSVTSPLRSSG